MIALVGLSIMGCSGQETVDRSDSCVPPDDRIDDLTHVWVCHHPGTRFHNKPCVDETFPSGCYVAGDTGKFCWLLTEEDCESTNERNKLVACEILEQEKGPDLAR